jgi:hypothetical protein
MQSLNYAFVLLGVSEASRRGAYDGCFLLLSSGNVQSPGNAHFLKPGLLLLAAVTPPPGLCAAW